MSTDAGDDTSDTGSKIKWAIAVETAIAVLLAGFGVFCVLQVKEYDPWAGFALIALAVLIYFMRGQVITKFGFGKDGLVAELKEKTRQAVATAEAAQTHAAAASATAQAAQKDATLAKEVITQVATVGGKSAASAPAPASDVREKTGRWAARTRIIGEPAEDDPQKNQWGGEQQRNGRRLDAEVEQIDTDWFRVKLIVVPTDLTKPVQNRVRFHLHDSFRDNMVEVKPDADGTAALERVAYGAFTVGAEVENEPETYLELDLSDPRVGAPEVFRNR
jgi:hypothetical protein